MHIWYLDAHTQTCMYQRTQIMSIQAQCNNTSKTKHLD